MSILHVTNGDSARVLLERSGVPGIVMAWADVLHEGPTPLASGAPWLEARARYFTPAGGDHPPDAFAEEFLRAYRDNDARLEAFADHDEVIFWFEHDLFDQLLLIRHLWWMGERGARTARVATRFSLVCGSDYLGMLRPAEFPPLFETRQPITAAQIDLGTRAWQAFTAADPMGLVPLAAADHAELPFLRGAVRRHLEEFPAAGNGLARSERQILEVLSEGPRTPEEAFVEASRLEEHIFMGDLSFGTIVRRLSGGPRPLITAHVQPRPGRLPAGTLVLTADGAAVLAGRADHVALNGVDRWLGGVRLVAGSRTAPTSTRLWRWTGSTLTPSSPSPLPPAS